MMYVLELGTPTTASGQRRLLPARPALNGSFVVVLVRGGPSGAGDFGFAKPQLVYRRILWGSDETYLAVHDPRNQGKVELLGRYGWPECYASWNWDVPVGSPVTVDVYSAAPEVELLLNGVSQGRKPTKHNAARFELAYEPGTLTAVSRDGEREVSRNALCSGGRAAEIRLTPDKTVLAADGESLCFAAVELVDNDGLLVPWAEAELTASVEGEAILQAFGFARPKTDENYTKGAVKTYQGRALAVIRSTQEQGTAVLHVTGGGLELTIQ